jgi:hypothetical protein
VKLTNHQQVRAIDVFLTTIFKAGLLPYLRLAIVGLKRNTLIEHKEIVIVCEESGLVSMIYNVLLTQLKANASVKLVVLVVIVKLALTCTNYGKTSHSVETCHNKKREVPVVPIVKFTKHVVGTKTQLVKLGKVLVYYPYIICYNIEHRFEECPRKIEVHNMF